MANDNTIEDLQQFSKKMPNGNNRTYFSIPGMRCGGCVARIEKIINAHQGILGVRANLSKKQLCIDWSFSVDLEAALNSLRRHGYDAVLIDPRDSSTDALAKRYLRATAVAGFAAGNIMMLSVAVWAGADKTTQTLFHSLSAILAVLAIAYSGSIFFESAWSALKRGRTNMDVPISIGILLSTLLGLYDTLHGNEDVYFEAATMLIFFLLVGRVLDQSMRTRAESTLHALSRIVPKSALRLNDDQAKSPGSNVTRVNIEDVKEGDYLHIATDARLPVDALMISSQSDFDTSIVDGEPLPKLITTNQLLDAGIKNVGAPIVVKATKTHQDSFLSRTQKLVGTVSLIHGHYRTVSERVARWYAPVVHLAALIAGLLWMLNGAGFHQAITVAIAVLIITCPCALGLAVPMVQVIAAGKLFKNGVVMKNGAALERLALVDCFVFDKTGTLTEKVAKVGNDNALNPLELSIVDALARQSSHPFARSIVASSQTSQGLANLYESDTHSIKLTQICEFPGKGVECVYKDVRYRLGKCDWAAGEGRFRHANSSNSVSCFSADGVAIAHFSFKEQLRSDASLTVNKLKTDKFDVCILSGDRGESVRAVASKLGIDNSIAECNPEAKSEEIERLKAQGKKVLMVGDGINDTVALAAADVSFAMGDAGDIAANQADFVLMHNKLASVYSARQLATRANQIVKQNIFIAILYNLIALPLAFAGLVSPLVAAIAMSTSSLLVVCNSMRLHLQSMTMFDKSKTGLFSRHFNAAVLPQAGEL